MQRLRQSLLANSTMPLGDDEDINPLNLPSNSQVQLQTPTLLARSYTFLKERVLPQKIDEEEVIRLSNVQKFLKYRVFPTKLVTDVIQAFLVVLFVFFYASEFKSYKSDMSSTFSNYFMPSGFQNIKDNDDGYFTYYIYNVDDLQKNIQSLVAKYYSIQENSVSVFVPTTHNNVKLRAKVLKENVRQLIANETDGDSDPSVIDWRFIARRDIHSMFIPETIDLYENLTADDPLGSLFNVTGDDLKYVVDRVTSLELFFKLISLDTKVQGYPNCFKWTVLFQFIFDGGGRIPMRLSFNYENCVANDDAYYSSIFQRPRGWIGILLCFISFVSFIFYNKSLITRLTVFFKRRKTNKLLGIVNLFSDYLGFWIYVAFFKDIMLVIGYITMIIKSNDDVEVFSQTLLGIGSFLSLVNLTKYFNYQAQFYLVLRAFTRAIPIIIKYLFSIAPIFAGFVGTGVMWFGFYSSYFKNIDNTMVTLYSALQGDNLRIVFEKLYGFGTFYKLLGRAYTVVFLLLFICAIVNIFLSIVQESYSNVLMKIAEAGGEQEAASKSKEKEAKFEKLTSKTYLDLKKKAQVDENGDNSSDNEFTDFLPTADPKYPLRATKDDFLSDEPLFFSTLKKSIQSKLDQQYMGKIPTNQMENLKNLVRNANALIQKVKEE